MRTALVEVVPCRRYRPSGRKALGPGVPAQQRLVCRDDRGEAGSPVPDFSSLQPCVSTCRHFLTRQGHLRSPHGHISNKTSGSLVPATTWKGRAGQPESLGSSLNSQKQPQSRVLEQHFRGLVQTEGNTSRLKQRKSHQKRDKSTQNTNGFPSRSPAPTCAQSQEALEQHGGQGHRTQPRSGAASRSRPAGRRLPSRREQWQRESPSLTPPVELYFALE